MQYAKHAGYVNKQKNIQDYIQLKRKQVYWKLQNENNLTAISCNHNKQIYICCCCLLACYLINANFNEYWASAKTNSIK